MFTLDDIQNVTATYLCPKCSSKLKVGLIFFPTKRGQEHPKTGRGIRCNCGAMNKINYRVFKRRNGEPRLEVYSLFAGDEEFTKRFKDLVWC